MSCSAMNCTICYSGGFKMKSFPTDPKTRKIWVHNCGQKNFKPTSSSHIEVSLTSGSHVHFEENQFEPRRVGPKKQKKNAILTLFNTPNPPPKFESEPATRKSKYKILVDRDSSHESNQVQSIAEPVASAGDTLQSIKDLVVNVENPIQSIKNYLVTRVVCTILDAGAVQGYNTKMASTSQAAIAQKTWELSNNIEHISVADEIFKYDKKQQQDILCAKPWDKDPHFFKDIKISALALLKMVMHARSGGNLEVMGLLLGKVDGNTMIVMETFALPVEGTETRVNAQAQAYEYMTAYIESAKQVGRLENAIGWYHSHPGYGCWLSGIDVSTQMLNQNFQEPFVAIVIDPVRTISAGKVCIGAFRTYPKGYKPPNEEPSEYQTIPLNKIEDFGVHCKQYYSLDITYFKSSLDRKLLDSLWNKYWVNTLSSSSLITNDDYLTGQIYDLSEKLEQSESQVGRYILSGDIHEKKVEDKLSKATKDSNKTTIEMLHGLMAQTIKDKLFNNVSLRLDNAVNTME